METGNISINFSLCLVCQSQKEEELVENSTSYETLLEIISTKAGYGEGKYAEMWANLNNLKSQELKTKRATWHRKCYQEAAHSGMLKRAKEKYERELAGPSEERRKSTEVSTPQLTRSKTTPYRSQQGIENLSGLLAPRLQLASHFRMLLKFPAMISCELN